MAKWTWAPLLALVLLLVSCGGGGTGVTGNNGNGGSTAGQAQGVYSGTSSSGYYFESIVLPNDKLYALYGEVSNNVFYVYGMVTGSGTSNSGTYNANVQDFYLDNLGVSGTVHATYVVGSSFNGTLSEGGASATFTGTPLSGSTYNYNTAAQISSIAGDWSGQLSDGTTADVTISGDGSFTGNNLGCSFSGTATPDSSGKNFFRVTLTFGGSPCLLPNQTASGIGVYYLLGDGVSHELIFGGTTGNYGTVFLAAR